MTKTSCNQTKTNPSDINDTSYDVLNMGPKLTYTHTINIHFRVGGKLDGLFAYHTKLWFSKKFNEARRLNVENHSHLITSDNKYLFHL